VAGDLFGRNLTEQEECFEEGKNVFNLTESTGCSKVFYKCCKRYLSGNPASAGWQIHVIVLMHLVLNKTWWFLLKKGLTHLHMNLIPI
jgi:hypothetical protein